MIWNEFFTCDNEGTEQLQKKIKSGVDTVRYGIGAF